MKQRQAPRHEGMEARRAGAMRLAASHPAAHRRAFTLTELMIAVAVLIVVIIATSKIFGTASKIAGLGNATNNVMTEAATIERRLREDVERLTTEGFFAIHCVEVQNDVNVAAGGPLLNPNMEPTAKIRCDQLVFFATGVEPVSGFRFGAGANQRGQSVASRIYWGHAFQLREGAAATFNNDGWDAHDPALGTNSDTFQVNGLGFSQVSLANGSPIGPWYYGNMQMVRTRFESVGGNGAGTNIFQPNATGNPTPINANQPMARQWLLVRQPVALMDDDNNPATQNSKTVYVGEIATARSIFLHSGAANPPTPFGWSREVRNGRMDAAATQLDDIRRRITSVNYNPPFSSRPWFNNCWTGATITPADQRRVISSAVYYPRAERKAPSPNRVDQSLTNHVVGSGCSSFIVEWTYDNGVGDATNNAGVFFHGIRIPPGMEQPWFGLDDDQRGVYRYARWPAPSLVAQYPGSTDADFAAQTIMPNPSSGASYPANFPSNIEVQTIAPPLPAGMRDYWAIFGYNQAKPFNTDPVLASNGAPNPTYDLPDQALGYTPFPSAIRVTMVLHDPEGRMEAGREFQFVIRLPKRVN